MIIQYVDSTGQRRTKVRYSPCHQVGHSTIQLRSLRPYDILWYHICWILKFLQWIGERLLPVTYWDIHVSIDEKLNSKELGKRIISSQLERGHPFGVTSVCFYCCNATKTSEKSLSIILHIPVPLPQIIHIQSSSGHPPLRLAAGKSVRSIFGFIFFKCRFLGTTLGSQEITSLLTLSDTERWTSWWFGSDRRNEKYEAHIKNTFWVLPGPKAARPAVLWLNSAIILIRPGSNVAMAESVANSSKTTGQWHNRSVTSLCLSTQQMWNCVQ